MREKYSKLLVRAYETWRYPEFPHYMIADTYFRRGIRRILLFIKPSRNFPWWVQQVLNLQRILFIKKRNISSISAITALITLIPLILLVVRLAWTTDSHSVCYYCYRLMLGAVTVSAICRRPCIQGEHRRLGFTQRFTRRSIEVLYVWVERRLKTQWAHQEVKELE